MNASSSIMLIERKGVPSVQRSQRRSERRVNGFVCDVTYRGMVEGRRLSTTTTMRYEERQGGGTFTYETGQTTLFNGRAVARVLAYFPSH